MRAHRLRRRRCRRTRTRLLQEKVIPRHRAWIREVRMAAGSGKAKGRHRAPPSPPSCSLLRNTAQCSPLGRATSPRVLTPISAPAPGSLPPTPQRPPPALR
ncbi:hypothetical protein PAHAL_2G239800 [Panicum hallii]|uniref:Uncharacterized protein n=1 Tax=Panicum hallii TaxID=206008 RepID=A0A2S3GYY8_9POAL|nr:hypothetical protein PAHAL_2G239800 [Panicum hallii]